MMFASVGAIIVVSTGRIRVCPFIPCHQKTLTVGRSVIHRTSARNVRLDRVVTEGGMTATRSVGLLDRRLGAKAISNGVAMRPARFLVIIIVCVIAAGCDLLGQP